MDQKLSSYSNSMKRVKDANGSIIRGALKTNTGAIIFNDPAAQKVYETKKNAATKTLTEIEELREQIKFLQSLLIESKKDNNG